MKRAERHSYGWAWGTTAPQRAPAPLSCYGRRKGRKTGGAHKPGGRAEPRLVETPLSRRLATTLGPPL